MHFSRTYGSDAGQNPVTYSTQVTYVMNRCMSVERSREHPANLQMGWFLCLLSSLDLRFLPVGHPLLLFLRSPCPSGGFPSFAGYSRTFLRSHTLQPSLPTTPANLGQVLGNCRFLDHARRLA